MFSVCNTDNGIIILYAHDPTSAAAARGNYYYFFMSPRSPIFYVLWISCIIALHICARILYNSYNITYAHKCV